MTEQKAAPPAPTDAGNWQFVGEAIQVEYEKHPGVWWPVAVRWRGVRYPVARVLSHWEDHSWRHVPPSQRKWYNQRHRNYFVVATENGPVLEIYMRRNALRKPWTLSRMSPDAAHETATPPAQVHDPR